MDKLVQTALLGTARANPAAAADSPASALAAQASAISPEWQLLLRAGADAVYRQAGRATQTSPSLPEPAPAESLPACSPGAARLIAGLLAGEHVDVLPEALARLRQARLRLPPALLPAVLDVRTNELRNATVPVIGACGHWLSQFNPAWQWIWEALPEGDELPADAERRWNEGIVAERIAILRRLRFHDPAMARDWLSAVWRKEKADFRAEAIRACEVAVSLDDESFLESALDDRSQDVRKQAANLLARLPDSGFIHRAITRADIALAMADGEAGRFSITIPDSLDETWLRDGIEAKVPTGTSDRVWWLEQLLTYVPPAHWATRFSVSAVALVEAAICDDYWGTALLRGWTHAAIRYRDADWAVPLFQWAYGISNIPDITPVLVALCVDLLAIMRQEDAIAFVTQALSAPKTPGDMRWYLLMNLLPAPWSEGVGKAYLLAVRDFFAMVTRDGLSRQNVGIIGPWQTTLSKRAAFRLPVECFSLAREDWPHPTMDSPYYNEWRRQIQTFLDIIRLRQRIIEEIPL